MLKIYSILIFCIVLRNCSCLTYKVVAERYSSNPIISKTLGAAFDWNAYPSLYRDKNGIINAILISSNSSHQQIGISKIIFKNGVPIATQPSFKSILDIQTDSPWCFNIAKYNKLFYTLIVKKETKTQTAAISSNPSDSTDWLFTQNLGFPECSTTLFATEENQLTMNYLFRTQDAQYPSYYYVYTATKISTEWAYASKEILTVANGQFDTYGLYPGSPLIQLKTGDFFHIYNGRGYPPNYFISLGFAVLQKNDTSIVVQKADTQIMFPEYDWEIGNGTDPYKNAIWLNSLLPDTENCPEDNEYNQCFFGLYTGAGAHIGAVKIIVSWA